MLPVCNPRIRTQSTKGGFKGKYFIILPTFTCFSLCSWIYFRLEKQVRDVVHKAFWDKLHEELNQDPPVFSQALSLIQEVKEVCLLDQCQIRASGSEAAVFVLLLGLVHSKGFHQLSTCSVISSLSSKDVSLDPLEFSQQHFSSPHTCVVLLSLWERHRESMQSVSTAQEQEDAEHWKTDFLITVTSPCYISLSYCSSLFFPL